MQSSKRPNAASKEKSTSTSDNADLVDCLKNQIRDLLCEEDRHRERLFQIRDNCRLHCAQQELKKQKILEKDYDEKRRGINGKQEKLSENIEKLNKEKDQLEAEKIQNISEAKRNQNSLLDLCALEGQRRVEFERAMAAEVKNPNDRTWQIHPKFKTPHPNDIPSYVPAGKRKAPPGTLTSELPRIPQSLETKSEKSPTSATQQPAVQRCQTCSYAFGIISRPTALVDSTLSSQVPVPILPANETFETPTSQHENMIKSTTLKIPNSEAATVTIVFEPSSYKQPTGEAGTAPKLMSSEKTQVPHNENVTTENTKEQSTYTSSPMTSTTTAWTELPTTDLSSKKNDVSSQISEGSPNLSSIILTANAESRRQRDTQGRADDGDEYKWRKVNVKELRSKDSALKDFIDFFFQKGGAPFIQILTERKYNYNTFISKALEESSQEIKNSFKEFKLKTYNIYEIDPPKEKINMVKLDFSKQIQDICGMMGVKRIRAKIDEINSYQDYVLGIFKYWNESEERHSVLVPEKVCELATEMLATVMALCYAVIVRMTARINTYADSPKEYENYTPENLLELTEQFVKVMGYELIGIAEAAQAVLRIASKSKSSYMQRLDILANQLLHGVNAIKWGTKAISIAIQYFYLASLLNRNGTTLEKRNKKNSGVSTQFEDLPENKSKLGQIQKVSQSVEDSVKPVKRATKARDFIDYFFDKKGLKIVTYLIALKQKYEEKSRILMEDAPPGVKERTHPIIVQMYELKKKSSIESNTEVSSSYLPSQLEAWCESLHMEVDIKKELKEFKQLYSSQNTLSDAWKERIKELNLVKPEKLVESCTEMLASIMILIFSIVKSIAESVIYWANDGDPFARNPRAEVITKLKDKFQTLDSIFVTGVVEILNACTTALDSIASDNPDDIISICTNDLAEQSKHAKNSVFWCIKAISPVFVYYNLSVVVKEKSKT